MNRTRRYPLILCLLGLISAAAGANEPASAAQAETPSQLQARTLLFEMARFLGEAPKFSVNMRAGFDVVQDNGQKIEFGERRTISLQRPNLFLSKHRESNGRGDLLLFDGKSITVSDAEAGVYSQVPQPGDIDASVVHFVQDLKMRLPLAPLFMSRLAEELQNRVRSIDYVELSDVLGEPAHHLAARTDSTDFQVWIRDGKQPLPLRVIISYHREEGQPQFWADFSEWNLQPRFGKNAFEFVAPKDARQIVFQVQLSPPPAPAPGASSNNDEVQR